MSNVNNNNSASFSSMSVNNDDYQRFLWSATNTPINGGVNGNVINNPIMMNSLWSPVYQEINDYALDAEFRRLSLMSSSSPNPYNGGASATNGGAFATNGSAFTTNGGTFATNGGAFTTNGGAFRIDDAFYPNNNGGGDDAFYSNGDLLRMRAQSAARAQFGNNSNDNSLYALQQQHHQYYRSNQYHHPDHVLATPIRSLNGLSYEPMNHRYPYNPPPRAQYGNGFRFNNELAAFDVINSNGNGYRGGALGNRSRETYTSLEELRGRIVGVAKDQYGCRFLQKVFEEGKRDEIHAVFMEVKDRIRDLMVDQFGNYLIQKMFGVCDEEEMTQLLLTVVNDERNLLAVCVDTHGTRAMQTLLENLKTQEQRSIAVSVLRRVAVTLAKSTNGHHVIQHCISSFPPEHNKHIINVVADNCVDIATDKHGCCVVQLCLSNAEGEPLERLVSEITANTLFLSGREYGNYVVQCVLGMKKPQATAEILAQLSGRFVNLSVDKFGSHVVEKCLNETAENQVEKIIEELISSKRNLVMIVQDQYGNYVAQCALGVTKGKKIWDTLVDMIERHCGFLHSHPHAKRVLARTPKGLNKHHRGPYMM